MWVSTGHPSTHPIADISDQHDQFAGSLSLTPTSRAGSRQAKTHLNLSNLTINTIVYNCIITQKSKLRGYCWDV